MMGVPRFATFNQMEMRETAGAGSSNSEEQCKDYIADDAIQHDPLCMESSGMRFHLDGHIHSMLYVHQVCDSLLFRFSAHDLKMAYHTHARLPASQTAVAF